MGKIISFIKRVICGFLGIMFVMGSLGGVITCFTDPSYSFLIAVFSLGFFLIGAVLLRSAFKKVLPESDQDSSVENVHPSLSAQYVESNGSIARADGGEITDADIPYLMQYGLEKKIHDEAHSNNPKYHRTDREDELSFNFMMKYEASLAPLVDQFENLRRAAFNTNDLSCRIELLARSLLAFEKARKFAYSKGKGGTIYFQDMCECLDNSSNHCYSYADLIQSELSSAMQERDVVIPGILRVINQNDGILQKNIYAELPSISKSNIQRIIRNLESEGKLTRVKKSGSYELHVV